MAIEPIIVSYSELDTFRQCPLKHFLAYDLRYKKPPTADGALAKGSLYHLVMEEHYNLIKDLQGEHTRKDLRKNEQTYLDAIRKQVVKRLYDHRTGEYISPIHELIEWMYDGYVEAYGLDLQWKILAVEHQIVTPLRDGNGRRSRYHLKAKIDLIVQDLEIGGLWVVDHKSGANLPTQMDLDIDDQFGLYQWAMNEMGKKVRGSIHNANRTQRNKSHMPLDTRLSRTYLNRSDKELVNLAFDAYQVARAAWPPKSQPRIAYSSPDPRQCGWKCDFKEAHLAMRKGLPMQGVMRDFGFVIDKTRH